MGYKLHSLTLENFVVFVPRTTIAFDTTTINYIEGTYKTAQTESNGAGKSLIIDAISLALFGKGVRCTYLGDYISPSNKTGGVYIGLELKDEANNVLKIERWKRPNSDANKAKVWYNNACISTDSTISKIDELINSYIGISHTNFLSCIFTVMLPGFLKLRPSQRFEMLEQALAVKKIDSVVKKINNQIKVDDERLSVLRTRLSELSGLILSETTKLEIYNNNKDSLLESLSARKDELSKAIAADTQYTTKLRELEKLEQKLQDKQAPVDHTINKLSTLIQLLEQNRSKLQNKVKSTIAALKKSGQAFTCDFCHSALEASSVESVKEHYANEIDTIDAEISSYSDKLAAASAEKLKLSDTARLLQEQRRKLSSSIALNQSILISCERGIESITAALDTIDTQTSQDSLDELTAEKTELSTQAALLEKQIKMSIGWKQAMSKNGLRLAYIKEEISTLSALASKYASAVYAKPMQVTFFIDDERDNPSLDFKVNGAFAGTFSTGEGRRLEIAMTLSLMSLLKSTGLNLEFLLLDEALDGLSLAGKASVLKVIDSIASEYQIVMISHDEAIKTRPGSIIKITKDDSTKISTVSQYTR